MANHEPEQPQITEETVLSTEAVGLTADPVSYTHLTLPTTF